MPYNTDERLKSYLDTNQLSREQLCRAILSIDRRFSDVHPRHPRGGPDGGRDIQALYKQEQKAFGAVAFMNQASDSDEQKKQIAKKFRDDVKNALRSKEKPQVFVFLTNVSFTSGEKNGLIEFAKKQGFRFCDVMDRERLRIALDSPDGFAFRFQYLGLPLSEAEQASFFAKWGDDINSIISSGLLRLEQKLDRILFLQEASEVLSSLLFVFQLKRVYGATEIGHFRVFNMMFLRESKFNILSNFSILFGSSDRSTRMSTSPLEHFKQEPSGIQHGISGGQWETYMWIPDQEGSRPPKDHDENFKYKLVTSSSGIGMDTAEFISIHYNRHELNASSSRLKLADIDGADFMPMLNLSLASKLKAIHIYANGYKIQEVSESEFTVDASPLEPQIPVEFTDEELCDRWVRILPSGLGSSFYISFIKQTHKRLFESPTAADSLASRRAKSGKKKQQ